MGFRFSKNRELLQVFQRVISDQRIAEELMREEFPRTLEQIVKNERHRAEAYVRTAAKIKEYIEGTVKRQTLYQCKITPHSHNLVRAVHLAYCGANKHVNIRVNPTYQAVDTAILLMERIAREGTPTYAEKDENGNPTGIIYEKDEFLAELFMNTYTAADEKAGAKIKTYKKRIEPVLEQAMVYLRDGEQKDPYLYRPQLENMYNFFTNKRYRLPKSLVASEETIRFASRLTDMIALPEEERTLTVGYDEQPDTTKELMQKADTTKDLPYDDSIPDAVLDTKAETIDLSYGEPTRMMPSYQGLRTARDGVLVRIDGEEIKVTSKDLLEALDREDPLTLEEVEPGTHTITITETDLGIKHNGQNIYVPLAEIKRAFSKLPYSQ